MLSLIKKKRAQLIDLCRLFKVKRLELFGSATGDHFDPTKSDLDFLVEFEPSAPAEHARRYFGLLASLRDTFGRKVDLVEIRAVRNPYFKEDIESTKVVIYGA